ncbi:UDP-glucose 6-dehydrogenase [Brevibacillus reuszeri]|uniref:UDP-glucose 6-dehydrogenase n=1 Tax=Brevibacillus reuszeri TaxID=54915 RepID=A0A0K9YK95_9BACL|nr:UDP-glucose/GDP-mannose dehydrogenase family protein [Brevibacillus reuszeri]KNB68620.1 nucleotide sugar dehydrogenase [Brevibacillus reuszeri]MED1858907.1 UDP-glucose/GDP-mannose dehydrogenase family protein [Brevibacillus reuszeri]GED69121.1 UDP-glucose 6-dehydrogenase [Brevibacillus reuszeri]
MNVVCIGAGYVGSVTGTAFAAIGHQTTIIDIDQKKIERMNRGESPIYEPGMEQFLPALIGRNLFVTSSYDAVAEAQVVFIAVGTPSQEDGTADLRYIKLAAEHIGRALSKERFTVIVNKSTVPVGTSELVASLVEEASGLVADKDFTVVSNPEFLREGYALEDVFFPDRIVVGTVQPQGLQVMRELYHNLIERVGYDQLSELFPFSYHPQMPKATYFETDAKSAELIKYAANAFLAVKISYINEMARLCEVLGGNVRDIAEGMGLDTRIGKKFLQVSSGWSGSCFPKDTAELLATSQKYGSEMTVVKAAIESNERMHLHVVEKVVRKLQSLNGKRIGILGLTFKPDTDDARKTQASYIIQKLVELGASVRVHDPQGMAMFQSLNSHLKVTYCREPLETGTRSDAVILLTHWQEYQELDWEAMYPVMRRPYVLDTRNYLESARLTALGFCYEGLGLSTISPSVAGDGVMGG